MVEMVSLFKLDKHFRKEALPRELAEEKKFALSFHSGNSVSPPIFIELITARGVPVRLFLPRFSPLLTRACLRIYFVARTTFLSVNLALQERSSLFHRPSPPSSSSLRSYLTRSVARGETPPQTSKTFLRLLLS